MRELLEIPINLDSLYQSGVQSANNSPSVSFNYSPTLGHSHNSNPASHSSSDSVTNVIHQNNPLNIMNFKSSSKTQSDISPSISSSSFNSEEFSTNSKGSSATPNSSHMVGNNNNNNNNSFLNESSKKRMRTTEICKELIGEILEKSFGKVEMFKNIQRKMMELSSTKRDQFFTWAANEKIIPPENSG